MRVFFAIVMVFGMVDFAHAANKDKETKHYHHWTAAEKRHITHSHPTHLPLPPKLSHG